MFSHSCSGTYIFIRWKMKYTIQLGFTSLNGTFHLSHHENICTTALINIHYSYTNSLGLVLSSKSVTVNARLLLLLRQWHVFTLHQHPHSCVKLSPLIILISAKVYSCSAHPVSRKLWTVKEMVSWMQQSHERYKFRTCYYAQALI